jgi:5-formyltetrahydrofolate cyclo-ligase
MTIKTELRSQLRQRRNAFRAGAQTPFPVRPELVDKIQAMRCIGSYCSIGSEPDLVAVNHMITGRKIALALPRVTGRGAVMRFHAWSDGDALEKAEFGFLQPLITAALVEPDLLLVPMLGFDRDLHRLGQGAGHYDRYCENYPGTARIGIAWSVQEVADLVADPWDMPMDAICTEKEWICAARPAMERP